MVTVLIKWKNVWGVLFCLGPFPEISESDCTTALTSQEMRNICFLWLLCMLLWGSLFVILMNCHIYVGFSLWDGWNNLSELNHRQTFFILVWFSLLIWLSHLFGIIFFSLSIHFMPCTNNITMLKYRVWALRQPTSRLKDDSEINSWGKKTSNLALILLF